MRILVTGGAGFLGAWIVRRLAAGGHAVRIFDLTEKRGLIAAIAGEAAAQACEWRIGDIVRADDVRGAAEGCDAIIHLAGVLTLACKADPVRGAQINLIGTLNIFEAARAHGIDRLIYTSTAGVYGPADGRTPVPVSHYGAFKLACEGCARAYWEDHRLASTGFRPYVVYGPGREGGLSAGPSLACRAAALGESYVFPYEGAAGLVYVDDVAAAYEAALLRKPDGAHVFNLIGTLATPQDVIDELRRLRPDADIRRGGELMPSAPDIAEGTVREILPGLPSTSLRQGIERTFAYYRDGGL
ncbi:NAD-dependent epimerase/dehydratase family protein [Bosea psychrotolerans]|uniref:Nucleoside-diphosphate-sugar epimerase n=1 Tax=Bosea psychrotolerans TaxID=1871628 RepID=A0A2S4MH36_9HYPH|nr:NAD(P)-dependent oxidoreductase [Bosea psychrotolerans]POR54064.1 nucleoside-diphosphate-sugar epimerase [Bosea psychrotolerans]